jgi:cytochrome c oxidase cbb3-type subunit III
MRWLLALLLLASCMEREERRLQIDTVKSDRPRSSNAWEINEGQRLFVWYNCTGCHFRGGGGIGPALMDPKWIYGSSSRQIVKTILDGRPNGMPAYGGKMPEHQAWQLAAYVRSLGGNVRRDSAPSRTDSLPALRKAPPSVAP